MKPIDILTALTPAVEALEALGIPYHIGGSVASAVHGIARSTADADLVVDLQPAHVPQLIRLLEADYFVQAEAVFDAIDHQSSFNLVYLATMVKIDMFIQRSTPFDREVQRRIVQDTLAEDELGRPFNLSSAEDTLLHKLRWYRMGGEVSDRQWNDILGIILVQAGDLDHAYLREWAVELGVTDLLERALAQTGSQPGA